MALQKFVMPFPMQRSAKLTLCGNGLLPWDKFVREEGGLSPGTGSHAVPAHLNIRMSPPSLEMKLWSSMLPFLFHFCWLSREGLDCTLMDTDFLMLSMSIADISALKGFLLLAASMSRTGFCLAGSLEMLIIWLFLLLLFARGT